MLATFQNVGGWGKKIEFCALPSRHIAKVSNSQGIQTVCRPRFEVGPWESKSRCAIQATGDVWSKNLFRKYTRCNQIKQGVRQRAKLVMLRRWESHWGCELY